MEEDGLFARLRSGWNKYRNSRTQEIEKQEIENPAEHYANVMGTTIAWQKHLPLLRATDELYSPEKRDVYLVTAYENSMWMAQECEEDTADFTEDTEIMRRLLILKADQTEQNLTLRRDFHCIDTGRNPYFSRHASLKYGVGIEGKPNQDAVTLEDIWRDHLGGKANIYLHTTWRTGENPITRVRTEFALPVFQTDTRWLTGSSFDVVYDKATNLGTVTIVSENAGTLIERIYEDSIMHILPSLQGVVESIMGEPFGLPKYR